ncbi:protein DpdE [Streptomyces sp. URMC 129]|uniref:protein DpdE n=1 Tax=Streptomyces sp. URMC 129 TaxID=3423407 RepID=UPI003F1D4E4B
MSSGFTVGHLVEFTGAPGIGRVGAIDGEMLRVDFFESVAEEIVHSQRVTARSCWRAKLEAETRVYWREPSTGDWLAGRVTGEHLPEYFIQVPNKKWNERANGCDLRVRWNHPVHDPLQVLTTGGSESGFFRDARLPFLRDLVAQRAACANMAALLSSAAEIFPHQLRAAMTVLTDPVQRYLIADEVGLGKTIEAGFVIRQTLLDDPQARITVVAPEPLRRQWDKELRDKFFVDDFSSARILITSHETPEKWSAYHDSALVIVEEAHALVQNADEGLSPYRELAALAHSAPKLLLLSATPVISHYATHLGLLHLLDRDLYSWDDREAFEHRYALRAELADSVYALDATFTLLLRSTLDDIRRIIPDDPRFEHLAGRIVERLTEDAVPLLEEATGTWAWETPAGSVPEWVKPAVKPFASWSTLIDGQVTVLSDWLSEIRMRQPRSTPGNHTLASIRTAVDRAREVSLSLPAHRARELDALLEQAAAVEWSTISALEDDLGRCFDDDRPEASRLIARIHTAAQDRGASIEVIRNLLCVADEWLDEALKGAEMRASSSAAKSAAEGVQELITEWRSLAAEGADQQ